LTGAWRLETGDWRLETGDWRLETGAWRLGPGDWRLETGDWRLETGDKCKKLKSHLKLLTTNSLEMGQTLIRSTLHWGLGTGD